MMPAYYSIIQFCPDFGRAECANVGLALFSAEPHFIDSIVTDQWRVTRFFGADAVETRHFNLAIQSLTARIRGASTEIRAVEQFTQFCASQNNQLLMTVPRWVGLKTDPKSVLAEMFQSLVGEAAPRAAYRTSKIEAVEAMYSRLKGRRVPVVDHPMVAVKNMPKPLKANFAWLNGRLNYVKTLNVSEELETAVKDASFVGAQGISLSKHRHQIERKLVIVPSFPPDAPANLAADFSGILSDAGVEIVAIADLNRYESTIANNARAIPEDITV